MSKDSHNLEVVSPRGSNLNVNERRKLPRISLTSEQFKLSQNGKIFSVIDLSAAGMAFRILEKEDLTLFPVGSEIDGTLNLRGNKIKFKARVKHLGNSWVGCEFEAPSPELTSALDKLLDPKLLGPELRPIPSNEATTLWYHGPSGTDLLLRRKTDGHYYRLTLFVQGSYIQWDDEKGVETGRVENSNEQSEEIGIVRLETLFLAQDAQADLGKLSIAKTLLLSSNLPEDLKAWCARHLEPKTR